MDGSLAEASSGIYARDHSQIDIFGGNIGRDVQFQLTSISQSRINIYGGNLSSGLELDIGGWGQITIYGDNFNHPYGIIQPSEFYLDGYITGTLLDGNTIDNFFIIQGNDASILLVPEPCTLGLLVLGGIALVKRRR